jgi:hypothetical protein
MADVDYEEYEEDMDDDVDAVRSAFYMQELREPNCPLSWLGILDGPKALSHNLHPNAAKM